MGKAYGKIQKGELDMFDLQKFGMGISCMRKTRDMTQFELADLIGISRQAVSRYECGESFPDISVLMRIVEIFKVTLDELIGNGDPTKTEAVILQAAVTDKIGEVPDEIYSVEGMRAELANVAPLLKASTLDVIASKLSENGIDISTLVDLGTYFSGDSFNTLAKKANFNGLEPALLEKLIPLLDGDSRDVVCTKIIDGELEADPRLIKQLLRYPVSWRTHSLLEAAILDGALDAGLLKKIQE